MANPLNINRAHVLLIFCLPIAVLVGYLLADPMQNTNLGLIGLLFGLLALPLMIKWYHLVLVFSCNAVFQFAFLPGTPPLWLLMAISGFMIALLNRCLDPERRIIIGGQVAWSLILVGAVVTLTAYFRGGAGLAALGGASYGGRRYIYIYGAILMYFALVSLPVPKDKRQVYTIFFFISSATSFLSLLLDYWNSKFWFLGTIVSTNFSQEAPVEASGLRFISLGGICSAGLYYMLVRYRLRGILSKFWLISLTTILFVGMLLTGFRSAFGFVALVFVIAFLLEGLHRTRYLVIGMALGLVTMLFLLVFSEQLPWQMQRAMSFLPIKVSPMVKEDAQSSLDWRMKMWSAVSQQVPQYFWEGKGFALDPGDMYMSEVNSYTKLGADSSDWAEYAGDYHNGPLSLVIPLGIWGVLAFGWFLFAALKMLYLNYKYSDDSLRAVNGIILAYFLAKMIFFIFLVGGFYSDFMYFTAIAGFAMSLNAGLLPRPREQAPPILTLATQRIARDI